MCSSLPLSGALLPVVSVSRAQPQPANIEGISREKDHIHIALVAVHSYNFLFHY